MWTVRKLSTRRRHRFAGRDLYLVSCASCHGKNAEGITTKSGGNYGPSLIGVGAAAVDFQVGTGRMPMALTGPQAPRKEPALNEEETHQVAAYIASLGPGPALPEAEYLDWRKASADEIREGGEFFRTNCTEAAATPSTPARAKAASRRAARAGARSTRQS